MRRKMTIAEFLAFRHLVRTIGVRNSINARRAYAELVSSRIDAGAWHYRGVRIENAHGVIPLMATAFGFRRSGLEQLIAEMENGSTAGDGKRKRDYILAHSAMRQLQRVEKAIERLSIRIRLEETGSRCSEQACSIETLHHDRGLLVGEAELLKSKIDNYRARAEAEGLTCADLCPEQTVDFSSCPGWQGELALTHAGDAETERILRKRLEEEKAKLRAEREKIEARLAELDNL